MNQSISRAIAAGGTFQPTESTHTSQPQGLSVNPKCQGPPTHNDHRIHSSESKVNLCMGGGGGGGVIILPKVVDFYFDRI